MVGGNASPLPLGIVMRCGRQWFERWTLDRLEQLAPALAELAHDLVIEIGDHSRIAALSSSSEKQSASPSLQRPSDNLKAGVTKPSRYEPGYSARYSCHSRTSVTLRRLSSSCSFAQSDGYGYSRCCDLYSEWRRGISAAMRQTHAAGEKLFVDFAGRNRASTNL